MADDHVHSHNHDAHANQGHGVHGPTPRDAVIDPVCGMTVDPATHRSPRRQGPTITSAAPAAAQIHRRSASISRRRHGRAGAEGTIYTCPMHPEIRQVDPGTCPICGMALEPANVTADTGPNPELIDMTRRFWIGLALSSPSSCWRWAGTCRFAQLARQAVSDWVQFALRRRSCCGPAGRSSSAVRIAATRTLNMFTLIALGVGVAYLYSLVAMLAPAVFPAAFRGTAAPSPSISKRPRSSPCSFCSARCSSCARANARRRDPRVAQSRAEDRAPDRADGGDEEDPLDEVVAAIGCACAPARRCRSTANSSRAARRSTNRW